jgi:hypothetical protein
MASDLDVRFNTWPGCGEIDIMEHKGNEPNVIHGTPLSSVPEEMQMEINYYYKCCN